MNSLTTINYIKCLNRTDLIKYLREENYTAVAEILQPRDIDGKRFLELNELDLVQWRLNPKQKKTVLQCRDKLIDKKPPQMLNKPPVALKPAVLLRPRISSNNAKIANLQSKLQLEKIAPCGTKITHNKGKVYPKTIARNSNDDQYMDMTQDNAPIPLRPVKNHITSNVPNQYPNAMQNTKKKVIKSTSLKNPRELMPSNKHFNKSQRSLPTPPQLLLPIQNKGFNRGIQDDEENYENPDDIKPGKMKFENTKTIEDQDIYEDPDIGKNQILASSFPQNLVEDEDNYEDPLPALPERPFNFSKNKSSFKENDEDYEDPISNQINKMYPINDERSQTQLFSNQIKPTAENKFNNKKILPKFQKPVNFSENKSQDGDDLYEDPQETSEISKNFMPLPERIIKKHKNPMKTQMPSDDETYEDPDMVKSNYFCKNAMEDYETPTNCIMTRPLPPLPPKSCAEDRAPAVPTKLKAAARNKQSKDDFFDNQPHLRSSGLPPGYDNHRLMKKMERHSSDISRPLAISQSHTNNGCWEDALPPPPLEFESTLPKEKGDIWNSFDQSGLPTPPKFGGKFKRADSAYMKMYVEAEEQRISSKNFNPNDFPFFRNTDRKGGRQLLERIENIQNGAFLIRKSNEFFLVITMFYKNRFYNVGIDKNDDGTIYCKTTEDKEPKTFNTLYQFVEYYKTHPLTMTTKGTVINIYLVEQLTSDIF